MQYMDDKLLAEARARQKSAQKRVMLARLELDEAESEVQRLNQAVETFEGLAREHDSFSDSAHEALG